MQTPPRLSTLAAAILLCGALLPASPPPVSAAETADDTVVARFGTEKITRKALVQHVTGYFAKPALDTLADQVVLREEADRYKVSVTDAEIDARAAEIKKAAADKHDAILQAEGIDEAALRQRIRYTLLSEKITDKRWPVKEDDLVRASVRYARLQSEKQAKELISEHKRGVAFELLVLQRSQDKENGGLIQPDPFFRIDNVRFFKATVDAGIPVGRTNQEPISSGGFWLVVKLEKLLPASTLTATQKAAAIQRIRAARMTAILFASRRRYEIKNVVPLRNVVGDASPSDDTEVSRVTLLTRAGTAAPPAHSITRKQLTNYLLEYHGKTGLEQLLDRALISQEARRLNVSVTDAEAQARVDQVKKDAEVKGGKGSFQTVLDREGISEEVWRARVRYTYLAEKVLNARNPVKPADLERLTVRYIRVATQKAAQEILEALAGKLATWEQAATRSLDRGDGFVQPKIFMRVDNPAAFAAIPPGTAAGQVVPRPVELAGSFYVLRVEGRFGPNLMTAQERDAAVRQINASRVGELMETLRKAQPPVYVVPIRSLIAA